MPNNKVYVYKLKCNQCGHYEIYKKYLSYATSFTSLKRGDCPSLGYNIPDGKSMIKVPILGNICIEKFKKN